MRYVCSPGIFRLSSFAVLFALSCAQFGCDGSLGVTGGNSSLVAKFQGVDSVTVLSPTAIQVNWTPSSAYTSYSVYTSKSSTSAGKSLFNSFVVTGLSPQTTYSFSVAATKADGSVDGIAKAVNGTTWSVFTGPTSAVGTDANDIVVKWNYPVGPTFQVYYAAGAPPTATQLAGAPGFTSQSATGASISGLMANTTYYASVVAQYPDGTNSLTTLNAAAGATTSQDSQVVGLLTLPSTSTGTTFVAGSAPSFTVSGAPATYVTKIYLGFTDPDAGGFVASNLLATINASNTATASIPLALGTYNFSIKYKDLASGAYSYAMLTGISAQVNPASALPSVSATTLPALTQLPTITTAPNNIGGLPAFSVSGAGTGYLTQFYYPGKNGSVIAQIGASGPSNGIAQTSTSNVLPRGLATIYPKVSYQGQIAWLPPITVAVRALDGIPGPSATPAVVPFSVPATVGGSPLGAGRFGSSMVAGDFNCDGFQDLAVVGQTAVFAKNWAAPVTSNHYTSGGISVVYGKTDGSGLDFAHPTALDVGIENATNGFAQGIGVVTAVAAGVTRGPSAKVSAGTLGCPLGGSDCYCSDLVASVMMDVADSGAWNQGPGSIRVFYGQPAGLQTTPPPSAPMGFWGYVYNDSACSLGSLVCPNGKYGPSITGPAALVGWPVSWIGISVAVGDFDGDGYDDVALGLPGYGDPQNSGTYDGTVLLYSGTGLGLNANYTQISLPVTGTMATSATFGNAVAFARISDNTPCSTTHSTPTCKHDLVVGSSGFNDGTAGQPGAAFWIRAPGTGVSVSVWASTKLDANNHLLVAGSGTDYEIIRPSSSSGTRAGVAVSIATADVNGDGFDDLILGHPADGLTQPYAAFNPGSIDVYYGFNDAAGHSGIWSGSVLLWTQSIGETDNGLTACSQVGGAPYTGINGSKPCLPQRFYISPSLVNPVIGFYTYGNFGASVVNLGDVNGDGYADVGVSMPGETPLSLVGMSYIFYGSALGLSRTGATQINLGLGTSLNSQNPYTFGSAKYHNPLSFGAGMVGAKFTSGAGHACVPVSGGCNDVMVGAPGEAGPVPAGANASLSLNSGIVHAFYNPNSLTGSGFSTLVTNDSTHSNPNYMASKSAYVESWDVKIVGDINHDGFADVVQGLNLPASPDAIQNSFVLYYGTPCGILPYVAGQACGTVTRPQPLYNPINSNDPILVTPFSYQNIYSATQVFAAGDMDGDGYADLMVLSSGSVSNAALIFLHGSKAGLVTQPFPVNNPASPATDPVLVTTELLPYERYVNLPSQTLTHGDFNNDGYSDVAFTNQYVGGTAGQTLTIIYGGGQSGPVGAGQGYNLSAFSTNPGNYNAVISAGIYGAAIGRYPVSATAGGSPAVDRGPLAPIQICNTVGAAQQGTGGNVGVCSGSVDNSILVPFHTFVGNVTTVGDTDGDGTDDLIMVDPAESFAPNGGGVFIFYGSVRNGITATNYANFQLPATGGGALAIGQGQRIPAVGAPGLPNQPTWALGAASRAYDINKDGLADFIVSSPSDGTTGSAFVIHGVTGGYCRISGQAAPCNVTLTDLAALGPDYNPLHIVDSAHLPACTPTSTTSCQGYCNTANNQCNILRLHPSSAYNGWRFGYSAMGVGDITGDGYADIAVMTNISVWTVGPPDKLFLYSGSPTGIQAATLPVASPSCTTAGTCQPTMITLPQDPSYIVPLGLGSAVLPSAGYFINGYMNSCDLGCDIDGDGRPDFLVTAQNIDDPFGSGFFNGGFWIFH